jgi:two-component system, LytTR family, sensor kinase
MTNFPMTNDQFPNSPLKIHRIVWHILFWVSYIGVLIFVWGAYNKNFQKETIAQSLFLPEKLMATYFIIYFLFPQYLMKGKYLLFSAWFMVVMLGSGCVHWSVAYFIAKPIIYTNETWGSFFDPVSLLKSSIQTYPVVGVACFIKFVKFWYEQKQNAQLLKQEKLEAELKFLKSQIHPHFLFNTLNNLYALTLKKSDLAPEVVLKLSQLLDYMLYECDVDKISIQKEIDLVQNYIGLEQLRYSQRLNVSLEIEGDALGKTIAPMLILPFVENSFKHGLSDKQGDVWIKIFIRVEDNYIKILVENSKSETQKANKESYKEGIGLKNVQRRLELLYPQAYELIVEDWINSFSVALTIYDITY